MQLFYRDLRYYLTIRLIERGGEATVAELVSDITAEGFETLGRPSRTVSDAFRSGRKRGHVIRVGRGRYRLDHLPRTSKHRMSRRVAELRMLRSAKCDTAVAPWGTDSGTDAA